MKSFDFTNICSLPIFSVDNALLNYNVVLGYALRNHKVVLGNANAPCNHNVVLDNIHYTITM